MKKIMVVLTMLAVTLMVGCAGMQELPGKKRMQDGTLRPVYLSATTVKDSMDRSGTGFQRSYDTGLVDESGEAILEEESFEIVHGPTVEGQLIVGAGTVATGGIIAGKYQVKAAKEINKGGCGNGGCGGGGTTQIGIDIDSSLKNDINTNSTTSVGCTTCVLPTN